MRALVLPALMLPALLFLAACDPQALADKTLRRTAASIVQPVLAVEMPSPVAARATECILDASTQGEINGLARDFGASSVGPLTVENIRIIAERPAATTCFAANGVPPLRR